MQKKAVPSLLALIIFISLGSVGTVIYSPGLPALTKFFGVSVASGQFTVTIFVIGYTLAQLIFGPIANRYGRKVSLYIVTIVAMLGSLGCALAKPLDSFSLMIIARLITALGSGGGLTLTFTLINDFYTTEEARKVTSYTSMSFAIMPNVGIAVGGFLVEHFGWVSPFYAFALYNLFALFLSTRLPESNFTPDAQAAKFTHIFCMYKEAFKNSKTVLFGLLMGLTTAIVYIYAASTPFVAIHSIGLSPDAYGLWNLVAAAGYIGGFIICAKTSTKISLGKSVNLGLLICVIGSIIFLTSFAIHPADYTLFIPIAIIYIGTPLIFISSSGLATKGAKDKASSSALMSFINMLMGMIGILVISIFHNSLAHAMPWIYLVISLIMIILFMLIRSEQNRNSPPV